MKCNCYKRRGRQEKIDSISSDNDKKDKKYSTLEVKCGEEENKGTGS